MRAAEPFCPQVVFTFPLPQPIIQGASAKAPRWKMAGKLEPLKMEPLDGEAEAGEGNEGKLASACQGRRMEPLSRFINEILIAVLKRNF